MTFNVAERIRQVREVETKIRQMEKEFDEKLKPLVDFTEAARAQLLAHLNETGQKSAATIHGTAYWKEKFTYRVIDKEEFQRHVTGTEQWHLTTWAAATNACEEFTQSNNGAPPGLARNAVNILYVNAPPKPRAKTNGSGHSEPPEELAAE